MLAETGCSQPASQAGIERTEDRNKEMRERRNVVIFQPYILHASDRQTWMRLVATKKRERSKYNRSKRSKRNEAGSYCHGQTGQAGRKTDRHWTDWKKQQAAALRVDPGAATGWQQ